MKPIFSVKNRIRSGYVISLLLLLLSYFLIFYGQQRLSTGASAAIHAENVISRVEMLKSEFALAESGARGFLVTRDQRFLAHYQTAAERIPIIFNELEQNLGHGEKRQLDTLRLVLTDRLAEISAAVSEFKARGVLAPGGRRNEQTSLQVGDSVRLYTSRLMSEANQVVRGRQDQLTGMFDSSRIVAIVSLGIVFAALLYSFITFSMENKARESADKRADRFRTDLESNRSELKDKNLEIEALRDLEKFTSTGRIARTIAHEVRNPLTNILLAAEQLQEMESKNPESTELLRLINRNATRINQLVSELLNATRFVNLQFETASLNDLVEETLAMAKDRIELNRVTVEKIYEQGICNVAVDREKIKVAFLNIIVNALEAMDKGVGVLQIKTRRLGGKCILEVRDNGKGMTEETIQKLFEPYFTNKPKGTGLGLTNTQNIVLNHHGKITVTSSPGSGSQFTIILDFAKEATA